MTSWKAKFQGKLIVCELNGEVGGTVLVFLCPDVMYGDQPFAVVENLVVDSQYRGNGLGTGLLREVERFCLDERCSKIMLMSTAARVDAHRFFERVGFLPDAKRGFVKYRRQFASSP